MTLSRYLPIALAGVLAWAAQLGAQAPTGSVTGRVVDSTSQQPLEGVTVRIVGTALGTLSAANGRFTVVGIPSGPQTLQAQRIGYALQQVPVTVPLGSSVTVQISLRSVTVNLNEVVVTGYGTQKRTAISGAVATVNADQANVGVQPNVNSLLQGRAAGVNVTVNSGDPGAGAQIRIRGGTSISASNEPLYVIDGVPIQNAQTEGGGVGVSGNSPSLPRSPLNLLNPNDIARITILKDAAATAIYGSRAANGVILIETKKGTAGQSSMEYDGYIAASSPTKSLGLLNGNQYRAFVQDQVTKGNLKADRLTTLGTANTNWEDAVTQRAITQNHNFSFTGGTQTTQYRASLNYMDNEGVVLSNGFRRYQGRLNGSTQALDDKLRLGLNLTASQVQNKYITFDNTGGFEGGVFTNVVNYNPTRPIMVKDTATGQNVFFEQPGQLSVRNPVALTAQLNDRANTTRILGNIEAAYALLPSLTASVNAGVDRSSGLRQTYFPNVNPVGALTNGLARQTDRNVSTATIQTLLTYATEFAEKNTAEIVGGYEYSDTRIQEFGAEARNFLTDAFSFNNLGAGALLVRPYSLDEPRRLASLFSRLNLGFQDKYFLTGVIRRDGSSVFGTNNKYAVFPAVSGAWRISQEPFMKDNPFSELRLRASYGLQGNQAITPFQSLILLGTAGDARYTFGDAIVTGVAPSQNANPNLKWEQTAQTDLAVDYGFSENRITGTLEYYVKNTRDLLLNVDVPQPAPVSKQIQNIGRVRNRGVEFSIDAQLVDAPQKSLTMGLVFDRVRNTVVNLGAGRQFIATGTVSGQGQSDSRAQRIIPGQPLGTFFAPQFVGVDSAGRQLFNKYTVTRDSSGREISRTRSGTTTDPKADDRMVLGSANPDFSLGLRSQGTWHKFDASFLVRASRGGKTFNNTALVYATKTQVLADKNFLSSALTDGIAIGQPAIYSSRYIEDASFLRLQNITVGYTINLGGGGAGRPNSARLYVSGDNVFLLSHYTGYDPEVFADAGLASRGIDYLSYPRSRTFTAGVRLGF
ncbi:MAG: SusC/RagA family TonB-linked outer membrane protein [Gemmatimonadaceae bacterium]